MAGEYNDLPTSIFMCSQRSHPFQVRNAGPVFKFSSISVEILCSLVSEAIPNSCRYQFRQSIAHRKEKIGHTTIDLGVALENPETQQDTDLACVNPMERLQAVRGHIVCFPLEFMCQEDLRPFFSESEYYTSPQVFHQFFSPRLWRKSTHIGYLYMLQGYYSCRCLDSILCLDEQEKEKEKNKGTTISLPVSSIGYGGQYLYMAKICTVRLSELIRARDVTLLDSFFLDAK